jgi:hypothetical protein
MTTFFEMRYLTFYASPLVLLFLLLDAACSAASVCPLFRCTPEIIALDTYSLNSTLDIKCIFISRIQDPSDIMWKFSLNKMERIINDLDGGVLAPFQHSIRNTNLTISNNGVITKVLPGQLSGSQSVLRVPLLNESYYTNYTIMHTRDSCQQTIRVHLKETALGYSNANPLRQHYLFSIFLCSIFGLARLAL